MSEKTNMFWIDVLDYSLNGVVILRILLGDAVIAEATIDLDDADKVREWLRIAHSKIGQAKDKHYYARQLRSLVYA